MTPLDLRDPFNRPPVEGPPNLQVEAIYRNCDSRSELRTRGCSRLLPNFGNHTRSQEIDLTMDCRDHHECAQRIGMVKSFSTNRLIGHPEDVWNSLTTVDDHLRTGEIPWGLSLERDNIGQRLLVALDRHAE